MQHLEDLIKRLKENNFILFILYEESNYIEYIYTFLSEYELFIKNDLIIFYKKEFFDINNLLYCFRMKTAQYSDIVIKLENGKMRFLKDRYYIITNTDYDLSLMIREHKLNIIKNL